MLMLVVLSVLILFLLIGTTYLMTSSAYQTASKVVDKANRTTFQPEDVLERALMQLLRDTNNRDSVVRYHSLLRDLYGTDGFVARVMGDSAGLPRYAGASVASNGDRGPTQGQMVELYVSDYPSEYDVLDEDNVVGLDFDENGLPLEYYLQRTDAYYEGCLLTMLEGPCRGDSVRVVDYDYLGVGGDGRPYGRLRVMTPRRLDGQTLRFSTDSGEEGSLADFVDTGGAGYRFMVNGRPLNGTGVGYNAYASPDSARLTALELVVDSTETYHYGLERALIPNPVQYYEPANVFLNLDPSVGSDPWTEGLVKENFPPLTRGFVDSGLPDGSPNPAYDPAFHPLYKGFVGPGGADESYDAADFQNMFLALQSLRPRWRGRIVTSNEGSLDPAVYATQRRVASTGLDLDGVTIPSFHRPALANFWFARLLNSQWLVNAMGHDRDSEQDASARVRAILDPFGQLGDTPVARQIAGIKRKFLLRPLREDHPDFDGSNPLSHYDSAGFTPETVSTLALNDGSTTNFWQLTFPAWEIVGPWDVDNDGDGVNDSVWIDLGLPIQKTEDGRLYKPMVAMLVEDLGGRLNLNAHGASEHFVNDDLDGSNLASIHGGRNLAQDYNDVDLGTPAYDTPPLQSSNQLAHGNGWGPADVSLRPILSPDLPLHDLVAGTSLTSDAQYDDYARLLVGRPDPANTGRDVAPVVDVEETWGRYGSFPGTTGVELYRPGRTYVWGGTRYPAYNANTVEPRVPYDFAGYPEFTTDPFTLSGFGERPDLMCRYAVGLSPLGLSVAEPIVDAILFGRRSLLHDSPYELDLSDEGRRRSAEDLQAIRDSYSDIATLGMAPINDDAPFSSAELERVLRACDADAEELPDRLWNLVDSFDSDKLAVQQAIADNAVNPNSFDNFTPNSLQTIAAQERATTNRRQVTTESFDLPVPNENWTSRLLLGADGVPGVPWFDTNADNTPSVGNGGDLPDDPGDDDLDGRWDEGDETIIGYNEATQSHTFITGVTATYDDLYAAGCDDYVVVMRADPPPNARITDFLGYRVTLELLREGRPVDPNTINNILFGDDTADATLVRSGLATFGGMLAPEVLAGRKMDLNRPFGDGLDNNSNGVVDEPEEAGEPWIDLNANGVYDGEPFLDLDGDNAFDPSLDIAPTLAASTFEYTMGRDANGRGATAGGGRVRDDARMARQLYARHLYCLMLAVMDENYLAPYDPSDPQVLHYVDPLSGFDQGGEPSDSSSMAYRIAFALYGSDPTVIPKDVLGQTDTVREPLRQQALAEARRQAMRKLTCRQIAQWAVNCVDIRDSDAIQTPFEYDENPWNGWNVVDTRGTSDPSDDLVFPIDGDLTTDENQRMFRQPHANGWADVNDLDGDGDTVEQVIGPMAGMQPMAQALRTRGVVWGAERPELLMTEGVALHDRRLSDEAQAIVEGPEIDVSQGDADGGKLRGGNTGGDDDDLDQRTPPEGATFLEIFNPWPEDAQMPAELYSRQADGLAPGGLGYSLPYMIPNPNPNLAGYTAFQLVQGVALDRLSNASAIRLDLARADLADRRMRVVDLTGLAGAADAVGRYRVRPYTPQDTNAAQLLVAASPVWRVICVEEHPDIRNLDPDDNPAETVRNSTTNTSPWTYSSVGARQDVLKGHPAYGRLQLPKSYANIARQIVRAVKQGGTVGDYLYPDPDWPEFDQFARPFTLNNDGSASTTDDAEVSYFDGEENVTHKVTRVQLAKPDRFIERAFYFIGAPEIPSTTDPDAAELDLSHNRNVTQPGVLIPDLTYEVRASGLGGVFEKLVDFDLSGERTEDLRVDQSTIAPIATKGLEIWQELNDPAANGDPLADEPRVTEGDPAHIAVHGNRFVVLDRFDADGDLITAESLPLAPVMPGRYAVIGSSGTIYRTTDEVMNPYGDVADLATLANRYTTIVSRKLGETRQDMGHLDPVTEDNDDWLRLRRIELIPSDNPNEHQVVIRFNGSYDNASMEYRKSEVVPNPLAPNDPASNINVTEMPSQLSELAIRPVVAVVVDGFSVSDPLDDYLFRRAELMEAGKEPKIRISPSRKAPEGETQVAVGTGTTVTAGYDQPFDVLRELLADKTTLNYRTLHLQRLANPFLPWNPEPFRPNGAPAIEHDRTRPVNPYLTIDSLPMDVFAYNGGDEPEIKGGVQRDFASRERSLSPTVVLNRLQIDGFTPRNLWRGFTRTLSTVQENVNPFVLPGGSSPTHPDEGMFLGVLNDVAGSGRPPFDRVLQHSLGFANRGVGSFFLAATEAAGTLAGNVDLNGDGALLDLLGAPQVNSGNAAEQDAYAAFHWPNRPYASEMELLLTPVWSSSRMLTYYSTFNPTDQQNAYDGEAFVVDGNAVDGNDTAELTNAERWARTTEPFGHLWNFFQTASEPAKLKSYVTQEQDENGDPIDVVKVAAWGAPHYYRILDYVCVPSRFVETDTLLNPTVFAGMNIPLNDPRRELAAPFNRVDHYREPGRVNLNTVVSDRDASVGTNGVLADPADLWSEVYDGLMHRRHDANAIFYGADPSDPSDDVLLALGQLGPAWRDVVMSRRGYGIPQQSNFRSLALATFPVDNYAPRMLLKQFPTFFANPIRSPDAGFYVPLAQMQQGGVDASWLRAHPVSPGDDGAWGFRGNDDAPIEKSGDIYPDQDGQRDDAGEAGMTGSDDYLNLRDDEALPDTLGTFSQNNQTVSKLPMPLFSGASTEPSLNTERNPQLRYEGMTRMANLATGRSGVFAVWITVGFFEVKPASDDDAIRTRYFDDDGEFLPGQEDFFFRVYQDGYMLGKEIGIETGENRRHRGFYLIDRTRPVAFKPGDDLNVDNAILLRRRIE